MLCKTIEYEDFLGNKRKDDCYFNLSEAEVVEIRVIAFGVASPTRNAVVNTPATAIPDNIVELFAFVKLIAVFARLFIL